MGVAVKIIEKDRHAEMFIYQYYCRKALDAQASLDLAPMLVQDRCGTLRVLGDEQKRCVYRDLLQLANVPGQCRIFGSSWCWLVRVGACSLLLILEYKVALLASL